jgi:hypothetical protein
MISPARLLALQTRAAKIEELLEKIEKDIAAENPCSRIKADLLYFSLLSFRFWHVPINYYDMTLALRAQFLGCNVSQLCKTIVFENVACNHRTTTDVSNSKFYCVIVQYIGEYLSP